MQNVPGIDAVTETLPPQLFKNTQDLKVGRYAKVLLTPAHAIKIQKVVWKSGQLNTLEWRGGTTVTLNALQELVSAKAFGNMGVGPRIYAALLVHRIPKWLEVDNKAELLGCSVHGRCWNLALVMQRMTGSLRAVQVMSPASQAMFWRRLNVDRIRRIVKVLSGLGYDHNDIRHDNIGFLEDKSGVNLFLMDYGYGRVNRTVDHSMESRILEKFCQALESVGAPPIVRRMIIQDQTL